MAQHSFYPTGAVSTYRTIVNSADGVGAIIDRGMGITEHSMSGVALYIKAIHDYINTTNVGNTTNKIVSGYFDHLGYNNLDVGFNRYYVSPDSVISGVNDMWAKDVNFQCDQVYVQTLATISGTFRNVIFDKSVLADPQNSYFTNFTLVSGYVREFYSGYLKGYAEGDVMLPVTGALYAEYNNPATHPYQINDEYCVLGDVLTKRSVIPDPRFTSQNIKDFRGYGIYDGMLKARDFDSDLRTIRSSGNITVERGMVIDASRLSSTQLVNESILSLDVHRHTGHDSSAITASGLNSAIASKENFSVVMHSGNINVDTIYHGTDVGFYTPWEVAPLEGVDDPQRLAIFAGSLVVIGKNSAVVFDGQESIGIEGTTKIAGFSNMNDPNGMGDSLGVFNFDDHDSSGYFDGTLYARTFYGEVQSVAMGASGVGDRATFDTVATRRFNHRDNFTRLNDKVYFSLNETYNSFSNYAYTIYAFDANELSVKPVAAVDAGPNPTGGLLFTKPFTWNDCYVQPYIIPESGKAGSFLYNPIYSLVPSGTSFITNSGLLWESHYAEPWTRVIYDHDSTSAVFRNAKKRFVTDYAHHDNEVYYLFDDHIHKIYVATGNRAQVYRLHWQGSMSLVSYANKLWTGRVLEKAFSMDGTSWTDGRYAKNIEEITGNTEPWVYSPVVYDGWLYAIAPPTPLSDWNDEEFDDKFLVNYDLPLGGVLVRRRAAPTMMVKK